MPARWSPRPVRTTIRSARRHLADAVHAAFWPAVVGAGVIVGLYLLVLTRGMFVAWDGWHAIPAGAR